MLDTKKTEVQEVDLTSKIEKKSRQVSPNNKSKSSENNSNFLEKLIDKKNKSSHDISNTQKIKKSKNNSSNINLDLTGVKFKKSKKNKSKPSKKTKKKEFPRELSKLSKKNHNFISQLLKPNLKLQKTIQKKNLKNLQKDSSSIELTNKKNKLPNNTKSTIKSKRSKKKQFPLLSRLLKFQNQKVIKLKRNKHSNKYSKKKKLIR